MWFSKQYNLAIGQHKVREQDCKNTFIINYPSKTNTFTFINIISTSE